MINKDNLLKELQNLPQNEIQEVYDFVLRLKQKEKNSTLYLSELSLKKDWLSPEEDEAWKDL